MRGIIRVGLGVKRYCSWHGDRVTSLTGAEDRPSDCSHMTIDIRVGGAWIILTSFPFAKWQKVICCNTRESQPQKAGFARVVLRRLFLVSGNTTLQPIAYTCFSRGTRCAETAARKLS